jgi:ERCC4-type nuclease
MKLRVDSNEPQEVIDALEAEGFTVEIGWILAFNCECGKLFKGNLDACPSCHKPVIREGDGATETRRVGDIVEDNWVFAIERKKGDDYRTSCKNSRIYHQMKDMVKVFGKDCGIMLEDTLDGVCADEPAFANWFRSIEGWCWNLGIHFTEAGSIENIAKKVKVIYEKLPEDWKERPCLLDLPDIPQQMLGLMECSGIGLETAKKIFFYIPSLEKQATFTIPEWMVVPRIGEKTATKLYNFYHKKVKTDWMPPSA